MTAPASAEPPSLLFLHRTTRDSRDLTYRLEILQQPERARACGSGTKAHTDRRPIDPPPVVQLRIYEGFIDGDPAKSPDADDVTFRYDANFFLFATLENARPFAHGRVVNAASQAVPVLSGMPVAGMAFLDRPIEAGYFMFPDLSVRHEGLYRLAFNLYEQEKEERNLDNIAAAFPPTSPHSRAGSSSALVSPDVHMSGVGREPAFDWRIEVKSHAFRVWSAKKFPGLSESTVLSRTIAEQGCRVRIRRDVRMRIRKRKVKKTLRADEDEGNDADADVDVDADDVDDGDDGNEGVDVMDCNDQPDRRDGTEKQTGLGITQSPECLRARSSSVPSDRAAVMARRPSSILDFALPPPVLMRSPGPQSPFTEEPTFSARRSHDFVRRIISDLNCSPELASLLSPATPPSSSSSQPHHTFYPTSAISQPYSRSLSVEPNYRAAPLLQSLQPSYCSSATETQYYPPSALNALSTRPPSPFSPYGHDRLRSGSSINHIRSQSPAFFQPTSQSDKPLLPPLSAITSMPFYSSRYDATTGPLEAIEAMDPPLPLHHAGDKRGFATSFIDHSHMPLHNGHRPDSIPPPLTCRRFPDLLSHFPSGLDNSMVSYTKTDPKSHTTRELP